MVKNGFDYLWHLITTLLSETSDYKAWKAPDVKVNDLYLIMKKLKSRKDGKLLAQSQMISTDILQRMIEEFQ